MGSRDAALELLSDGHTAAPLVRLGYLHSLRGGRSYFMHFKHQSNERDFPQVTIFYCNFTSMLIGIRSETFSNKTFSNKT